MLIPVKWIPSRASLAFVLVAACLWLAFTAWARPLALPDEGRYVGVAWEMVRSGHWLVPTLDGLPYFQKPPLFYWITACALQVFGRHEIAARIAPLVGAMLACASSYFFARRWWSVSGANRTLVTLATIPLFFAAAQFANMDMLVAGCISVSVLSFAHSCMLQGSQEHPISRLRGFAFAAFGVLAKGLIGVVLPVMVLVLWAAAARRSGRLIALAWLPGWLVFIAIAAPWFVLVQLEYPQFLHYFFVVQHVGRFTQHSFNNVQPFWFYVAALAVLCLPWSAWLLARRQSFGDSDRASRDLRLLVWIWFCTITVFFSIPSSKLVGYILPAAPPLAFIIAQRWGWNGETGRAQPLRVRTTLALACAACVGVIAVAAQLSPKSTKPLAAVLAQHGKDPVVFLQFYYFDLPFYANLSAPVTIIDDWDFQRQAQADNWHREVLEAATFAPSLGQKILRTPGLLDRANCPGRVSWVVGDSRLAKKYPLLAQHAPAAEHAGVSVWKVLDWVPDQLDWCTS